MLFIVLAIVYFVPSMVAWRKDAPRFQALFALNLLTGWTFIGWVAALIWAMVDEPKLTK